MKVEALCERREHRVLVLGLGNDLLTDDAVGLEVARRALSELEPGEPITVEETVEMGVALLDLMAGYQAVVLVDAVQTGRAPIGHVHELRVEDLGLVPSASPHFLGVGEVLALGRTLGYEMPCSVEILAIEVSDPFTLSTHMTDAVREVVESVTLRVLSRARALAHGGDTVPVGV